MTTREIWRSPERLRLAFKKWRKAAGLSQAEVADKLHLRPQAVGCFERAESDMSRASRQRLVEAMTELNGESFLIEQATTSYSAKPDESPQRASVGLGTCAYVCPADADLVQAQIECMRLGREDLLDELMNLLEEVGELRAQAERLQARLMRVRAELGIAEE